LPPQVYRRARVDGGQWLVDRPVNSARALDHLCAEAGEHLAYFCQQREDWFGLMCGEVSEALASIR